MALSNQPGKKLNIHVSDYCVFDLETTGVSSRSDAVIEISAVKVLGGLVVDEFTMLVNPKRPIPFYASRVNGITDDMVANAPTFDIALGAFLDFAEDLILVGHNIHNFDMKFLYRDAKLYWGKTISNNYIDTLPMAKAYLPQLEHHKLTDLAGYYGISSYGAHRALNDCRMNQQIYEFLGEEKSNAAQVAKDGSLCPYCGKLLQKRNGRYGEFMGCMGYPVCRYTRNV